ncbi:hypothetical protein BKA93DRAFT_750437 [Sparassis latifolia]
MSDTPQGTGSGSGLSKEEAALLKQLQNKKHAAKMLQKQDESRESSEEKDVNPQPAKRHKPAAKDLELNEKEQELAAQLNTLQEEEDEIVSVEEDALEPFNDMSFDGKNNKINVDDDVIVVSLQAKKVEYERNQVHVRSEVQRRKVYFRSMRWVAQ